MPEGARRPEVGFDERVARGTDSKPEISSILAPRLGDGAGPAESSETNRSRRIAASLGLRFRIAILPGSYAGNAL
jgi:hypothetical protein